MKYWDSLKNQIERGKKGLNTGIPFKNFTTLSNHIKNIQQGRYDLIFAGTGVGKSAFLNSTYVYGAIDFLQQNPGYIHDLEIIYYSLEINPEHQIAKHIASLMWEEYGILTTKDEILSVGNLEIPKKVEELLPLYETRMSEIQSKYIKFRSVLNPDFFLKDILTYAAKRGTLLKDNNGEVVGYIPNNPALITEIIIDHIGLIHLGSYGSLKEAIDKVSKDLVFIRKVLNFTPVPVSQINRSAEGMNRRDDDNWLPMLADIKNTGNMSEDAQTIIGLASPYYYGIDNFRGFDITRYKDRYRVAKICKNRDGSTNLLADFLFIGEYGGYYQLPKAEDLAGLRPLELQKIVDYYKENGK